MKFREEDSNGVKILRLEEARLDASISSELKTEILRLVEQEAVVNLLVDLQKVDYIDSSGLGALLFGHRHIKTNDGRMKLVHLNQKVQTLIKIAQLEDVFDRHNSEKEALGSF